MDLHETALPGSPVNRNPLTRSPEAGSLLELLNMALLLARKSKRKLAILSIELDGLGEVVEELGHRAGEELLLQATNRLRAGLQEAGVLVRHGASGFFVILHEIGNDGDAGRIAMSLIEQLRHPYDLAGLSANAEARVGLTIFPGDGDDVGTLLRNAGMAIPQLGEGVRLAARFFDPAMQSDFLARRALEADLYRALENHELVLHYQPVVRLPQRRLAGVEALIRWNHPEHGLIGPEVFLPTAEDSGLIKPIGRWVIAEACRQIADWRMQGLDVPVSVNVAARQLPDGIPPDWLHDTMERFSVLPRNLSFDFSERLLQVDNSACSQWLEAMARMQIRIGLDDFGAGKASLAQLKEFNIRQIKIGRTLVHAVRSDSRTRAMVKSVVDIGRNMMIRVTAAGVEDACTLAALHAMGCDHVQGFHLAVPDVPERIADLAAASAVPADIPPLRRVPDPFTALAFV